MYEDYNYQDETYYSDSLPEVKCPGKEITSFVMGIGAAAWAFFSCLSAFIPYEGIICAVVYILFVVGFAIASFVLKGKVDRIATVKTNKCKIGMILSIIGLVLVFISLVWSIVWTFICSEAFGIEFSDIVCGLF